MESIKGAHETEERWIADRCVCAMNHRNSQSKSLVKYAIASAFILTGVTASLFGIWASSSSAISVFEKHSVTKLFYNLNETYGVKGVRDALAANAMFIVSGILTIVAGIIFIFTSIQNKIKVLFGSWSHKKSIIVICLIWAISYLPLLSNVKMGGDACMYSLWMKNFTPGEMPLHWGIIALGIAWNAIVPLQNDVALNLFGMLMALGSAVIVFHIVKKYTEDGFTAIAAALFLLWCPNQWFHAVLYKSYASEMFFVFLSYYLWIRDKPVGAGLSFLVAMLITPLSVLAAPGFMLGKVNLKKSIYFIVASLPLFIVFLYFYRETYFYGKYGLFSQAEYVSNISFVSNLPGSIRLLAVNFNFTLPFIIAGGIIGLVKNIPYGRKIIGISCLGFISLVILQGKWVEFSSEILFFIFPAIIFGIFIKYLKENEHIINDVEVTMLIISVLSLFASTGFARMYPEYMARKNFRDVSIEANARMSPGAVVAGHWERIRQFEYYTTGALWTDKTYSYQGAESRWKKMDISTKPNLAEMVTNDLQAYPEVWILETNVRDEMKNNLQLEDVDLPSGRVWRWTPKTH